MSNLKTKSIKGKKILRNISFLSEEYFKSKQRKYQRHRNKSTKSL